MELAASIGTETATFESFEKALIIWTKKPHVVNRRLCGSEVMFEINLSAKEIRDRHYLKKSLMDRIPDSFMNKHHLINLTIRKLATSHHLYEFDSCSDREIYILLRHLISKNSRIKGSYELVIQIRDLAFPCVYFFTLSEDGPDNFKTIDYYAYKLAFHIERKKIELYCHKDYIDASGNAEDILHQRNSNNATIGVIYPSISWLSTTLLMKLKIWSQEKELDTSIKSLRLLNLQKYNSRYNELKERYAKHLIDMWPESTDPLKFVYEDIGIATYLLILWELLDERDSGNAKKSKVFVDLGCGNGLLVYLLNSEGHCGYGVDVRKRRIWELLKPVADLREVTVLPSKENQFPDADWLIGNHSDELTPWIPVMAARCTNKHCQYFVLPCCPWDFTCKFSASGGGKYGDYLNFIYDIGKVCGFDVEKDTLRIPSTRRVCFIGLRNKDILDPNRHGIIQAYIESRCQKTHQKVTCSSLSSESNEDWYCTTEVKDVAYRQINFVPRLAKDTEHHSLKLDSSFADRICTTAMNHLLKVRENYINYETRDERKSWNKGGSALLQEVCDLLSDEDMKNLKSSCGGLQTVLKNCADVFSVRNGEVTLRDWSSPEFAAFLLHRKAKRPQNKTYERIKTKICFFYKHHPDGCLLKRENCRFAHGQCELRNKSN